MATTTLPENEVEVSTGKKSDVKYVYFFGGGKADGNGKMKDVLGGKGAGLAEMTNASLPVPPGFTIQTEACREYMRTNGVSAEVERQMDAALKKLEELQGQKLGKGENPLLVSVRSGAKFSMPGMMDTVLNIGLSDESVHGLAKQGIRYTGVPYSTYYATKAAMIAFAVTLIVGIVTSMYTAVSVSCGIAALIYGRRRKLQSISI